MKQLHPRAVWIFFIWYSPLSIFFLPLVFSYIVNPAYFINNHFLWKPFVIVLIILLLMGLVFIYFWSRLAYKLYRYELTDLGFKKEQGVIFKKHVTIPYDRIQNIDIHRGIINRLLGLSDMRIQTAGSDTLVSYGPYGLSSEGGLPGLSVEVAEQLRDELIRRASHRT